MIGLRKTIVKRFGLVSTLYYRDLGLLGEEMVWVSIHHMSYSLISLKGLYRGL